MLGHGIRPKICTDLRHCRSFQSWQSAPPCCYRSEPFLKCRRVNVCQSLTFEYSWSLKMFVAKTMTLFVGDLLAWCLWRPDWWSKARTRGHFLLAASSGLLTPLLHAWCIRDGIMKAVATRLERKRLWSSYHQVLLLQLGNLFPNSWWESGKEVLNPSLFLNH